MLSAARLIHGALLALVATAAPVLDVKVIGPGTVENVANLKLYATVTNVGDQSIKLMNHPGSVLEASPTEIFTISHNNTGDTPKFLGIRVSYTPDLIIKRNDPSDFTIINPGEFVNVTHDLSSMYDFTETGPGAYTFLPSKAFIYVDTASSEAHLIYAQSADAHELTISGSLSPTSPYGSKFGQLVPGAFTNCTAAQRTPLNAAIRASQIATNEATRYTDALNHQTPRYQTWFGDFAGVGTARNNFDSVNMNRFADYNYICENCPYLAFVYANQFPDVHVCPQFFMLDAVEQSVTLIHEATHFQATAGTRDVVYGRHCAQELAKTAPDLALQNAENYAYYAQNEPPLNKQL